MRHSGTDVRAENWEIFRRCFSIACNQPTPHVDTDRALKERKHCTFHARNPVCQSTNMVNGSETKMAEDILHIEVTLFLKAYIISTLGARIKERGL